MESLQDRYSPNAVCFGCGPANPKGLHIKSRPEGDRLVADWLPGPHHKAFADFTSGGIIAMLLDCHGNMTAAYFLMKARGLDVPPGTDRRTDGQVPETLPFEENPASECMVHQNRRRQSACGGEFGG
jgi:hypothetical protein